MASVFASPGMITAFAVVLFLEAVSLLLLLLNVQIFRSQNEKYRLFLARLGDQGAWGRPGRFLVPIYVCVTFGAVAATVCIFLFQPHLL